ncbi:LOW QUALITY PROTEIN: hypothetical protein Cgig2_013861 [Carnegiea gigantea]|uniref:Uncharacterized protein n=1 Tax=Carnegiea gigantea TaxID=171969 RepID=A0A9Q1QJJ3_9CARY|nr:LOW QUALITY PROTEIN: hypothetical protein Cgig2_013861 [Carnegiea gigantea]
MDALKNFMTTMTDPLLSQVAKQVKKTMEAAISVRPLSVFDYEPTWHCESSSRRHPLEQPRYHRMQRTQKGPPRAFRQRIDRQVLEERPRSLPPIQSHEEPREKKCSTEVMATIAGGHVEGMSHTMWKVRMCRTHEVMTTERGSHVTIPIITFDCQEGYFFSFPHDVSMAIELKAASALVHIILIDIGKAQIPQKRNYTPGASNPGFQWIGSALVRTICLPLWFRDKAKSRNLEVDLLVVYVPTAYNVILGRLTLHEVKVIIASHFLRIWYKADNGSVGRLFGD